MTVRAAVERDLGNLPEDLRESGMAAAALVLAEQLDDPGSSSTSKSMCSKELRDTLTALRALAPPKQHDDDIDELTRRRAARRSASAG